MYSMSKKKVPIKYTSRDFSSIRDDLISYAKRYYPDTYKDFTRASFGAMTIDTVAYIGDILSFYLDYQTNETFLDTATEFDNILRLAKQRGYKFKGSDSTTGFVSFFVLVPTNPSGLGPDSRYIPILKKNSIVSSKGGGSYILLEDVRFDHPSNYIVPARVNETTGLPTHYAIKSTGKVISGIFGVKDVIVNSFERFKKIKISNPDIVEIVSVFDAEGHEYHEVEFLSHDVIYKGVPNRDSNTKDNAPSLLRPLSAPRRFTTEKTRGSTTLQFGYGSDSEIASPTLADPSNVVLQRFAKDYITDTAFDPSDLLGTDKLGISPANTTLTITFRKNTATESNAAIGSVTRVIKPMVEFLDPEIAGTVAAIEVIGSVECSNEEPINGSVTTPTVEEIRNITLNYFPTQNRAVTSTDYEALSYAMPSEFGSIKRCHIVRDQDSLKRNLNMYVLAESRTGKLETANSALKDNLKVWLNRYRMINDTIDILDAKIVNIGIEFEIVTDGTNKFDALDEASDVLRKRMSRARFIGERFPITKIYSILNSARGVADVTSVKVVVKNGGRYATTGFNVDKHTSPDGRYIAVPDNVALEIKFPRTDIKGSVK
jgi:hypothetical protein